MWRQGKHAVKMVLVSHDLDGGGGGKRRSEGLLVIVKKERGWRKEGEEIKEYTLRWGGSGINVPSRVGDTVIQVKVL